MTFERNKQNLIADTQALIELGTDRSKLLEAIQNGDMDETIKESGDCMKTADLGDLCNELVNITSK